MIVEDFFSIRYYWEKEYKTNYSFQLKWGIPVRYHDFKKFNKISNPELFEFHLSYSDMDLKISDFIKENINVDLLFMLQNFLKGVTLWI